MKKENLLQETPFATQRESMLGRQSEVRGRQSVNQTHAQHSINRGYSQSSYQELVTSVYKPISFKFLLVASEKKSVGET